MLFSLKRLTFPLLCCLFLLVQHPLNGEQKRNRSTPASKGQPAKKKKGTDPWDSNKEDENIPKFRNAEEERQLKENWLLPMDEKVYLNKSRRFVGFGRPGDEQIPWPIPGTTVSTPSGFGAQWGDIFAAVSIMDRSPGNHNPDAYAAIGMGFGNSTKYVAMDVSLGVLDIGGLFKSFSTGLTLSPKIHHVFPWGTSVAVGRQNAVQLTSQGSTVGGSNYLGISHAFRVRDYPNDPFGLLIGNIAIGDGQFNAATADFQRHKPGYSILASAAIRIFQQMTFITDWNHDLNLAVSASPFRRIPVILTLAALDTLHQQGDGVRWVFGIAWGDSIFSDTFPFNFGQKK